MFYFFVFLCCCYCRFVRFFCFVIFIWCLGFLLKLLICTNRHWGRKLKHKVWGLSRRLKIKGHRLILASGFNASRDGETAASATCRGRCCACGMSTSPMGDFDSGRCTWREISSEWLEPCAGSSFMLTFYQINYAQCVDIAVTYFANVNVSEQYCWILGSLTHGNLYISICSI